MSRNTGLLRLLSALLVFCALLFPAAPANAAFTDRDREQNLQTVTSGTILAPAAATVRCETQWWLIWRLSVVTVESFSPVPRATSYELKVFDPDGTLRYTGDPDTSYTGERQRGEWRYEIRTYYKATGAPSPWSSNVPLKGKVTCP